jgi:hypothetical protein
MRSGLPVAVAVLSSTMLSACLMGPDFYQEYRFRESVEVKGGTTMGAIYGASSSDEAHAAAQEHCARFMKPTTLASYTKESSLFYCGDKTW